MTVSTAPGSPLVGQSSPLNAADQALIARLNDEESAHIAGLPSDDPNDPRRQRRVGFTLPEILDQPACIENTVKGHREAIRSTAQSIAKAGLTRIVMTGCGDSLAVHEAVRSLMEMMTGVPCEPVQALELAYYQNRFIDTRTLVIGLSSSGWTPRTLEGMLLAKQQGAGLLALTNTAGSAITDISDYTLMIEAQRKGWPTQSSTAAIALLAQLALDIGEANGLSSDRITNWQQELDAMPATVSKVLEAIGSDVEALAHELSGAPMVLFTGAGPSYAAARFGAAKIKECTSGHALAIPLEEFHHYTSIKPGEPLFIVAPQGSLQSRALDTARRAKVWHGRPFGILDASNTLVAGECEKSFVMPPVSEELSSIIYSLPVQVLAVHMALKEFETASAYD
ncbi:MAG: SIS domain-containing protein [Hyphomicrobiales bacterium]|jgi:glucosamine--fructose-6-phosphate aminotransferase (isomerizing)